MQHFLRGTVIGFCNH